MKKDRKVCLAAFILHPSMEDPSVPAAPFKIDLHTHILPRTWPDLRRRYGYGGFVQLEHHGPGCARLTLDGKLFREVEANCWHPARRIAEARRHGVKVQVLSTVP